MYKNNYNVIHINWNNMYLYIKQNNELLTKRPLEEYLRSDGSKVHQ